MENQAPMRGLTIQCLTPDQNLNYATEFHWNWLRKRTFPFELLLSEEPLKLNGTKFLPFRTEYRLFERLPRMRQLWLRVRTTTRT